MHVGRRYSLVVLVVHVRRRQAVRAVVTAVQYLFWNSLHTCCSADTGSQCPRAGGVIRDISRLCPPARRRPLITTGTLLLHVHVATVCPR